MIMFWRKAPPGHLHAGVVICDGVFMVKNGTVKKWNGWAEYTGGKDINKGGPVLTDRFNKIFEKLGRQHNDPEPLE